MAALPFSSSSLKLTVDEPECRSCWHGVLSSLLLWNSFGLSAGLISCIIVPPSTSPCGLHDVVSSNNNIGARDGDCSPSHAAVGTVEDAKIPKSCHSDTTLSFEFLSSPIIVELRQAQHSAVHTTIIELMVHVLWRRSGALHTAVIK